VRLDVVVVVACASRRLKATRRLKAMALDVVAVVACASWRLKAARRLKPVTLDVLVLALLWRILELLAILRHL
jgi:hypothetical protein